MGRVAIRQWGKVEYDSDFLVAVAEAIAERMPGAEHLNFQFEFRKNMAAVCGSRAEGVHTFDLARNLHVIAIDKCFMGRGLEPLSGLMAHEMGHAVQRDSGRLQIGRGRTGIWDGEPYSYDLPWGERPWETDAIEHEQYGEEVFRELERNGLVPATKSEVDVEKMYVKHPQLRPARISSIKIEDLPDDLTRAQLLEIVKVVQSNADATLEELLDHVGYDS